VAPKLNFRMSIPSDFRDDWSFFNDRAKIEGMTPAELLQDLIDEYISEFQEEREKAEKELDEVAGPLRDKKVKKKVLSKKKPKQRKSFVSKVATIKQSKVEEEEESVSIIDTPKFKLIRLARSLDLGDGINPDDLLEAAGDEGILNPRLQMNKMIRRGILYIHVGRVHVA